MESKANNRGLKSVQDQKLANPHAIRPKEDFEIIRKAVYHFEQYLKKCAELKGPIRPCEEVRPILDCLQELSDEKESKDHEENRSKLRELLVQLLGKVYPAGPNQLLFDEAYKLLFIWTKYWPKNKRDQEGSVTCFYNNEPINNEEERFIFPLLGYQYKANDNFWNIADPQNNKGFFPCEEGGG